MSCPCTGEFANVYLTINNLEDNFNAITGNTLLNYNQLSRIVAQQGNIYDALYNGNASILTGNANISGNTITNMMGVSGNITYFSAPSGPIYPTVGSIKTLVLPHNTNNGLIGSNFPNPECMLLMTNVSTINLFPWGMYMGIVKDAASTSPNSLRLDLGRSANISTNLSNAGSNTIVPIMTIRYNGNVGIGVTSPAVQFQLSTDGARKLTTTTWSTGSDYRIKENIIDANIDRCYEIVSNVKLKHYRWIDDIANIVDDKSQLGWIAQDVETVFPNAVTTSNTYGFDDFRSLNADQMYKVMYGALTKVIQKYDQYQATIKSHEETIQSLLTRITALKNT